MVKLNYMKIKLPLTPKIIKSLKAGQEIFLSGVIYTARDAAHKKLLALIKADQPLPFELKNNLIYYTGPTPAPPGKIIGSAGPTTANRMDKYIQTLYEHGLKATLGKGPRSSPVAAACKKFGAVYFVTYGGLGAYLSQFIKKARVIAFPELEPEAVYELQIKDFPAIVAIDSRGTQVSDTIY